MYATVDDFMERVKARNPGEREFHQAVHEVVESLWDFLQGHPMYLHARILERLIEPERIIIFRVPWINDRGEVEVNRGYRIEFNSALGPYKGGLRFHPSVTLSILKFLAFEQVFKNSLTTLPMGGGKGGSDFDPKGKSDGEVMRFCQSFMTELSRHIGPNTDVPAGDVGVGTREIGYLFGQYKRLRNEFTGGLTGKGVNWGGSLLRLEATGYGVVYFTREMLKTREMDIEGKVFALSGYGNVAWGVVQKINQLGGKVVTLSGSDGYVYDEEGVKGEKVDFMQTMRAKAQDMVEEYAQEFNVPFYPGERPWGVKVDVAIPCATENEIREQDAQKLIDKGCVCVVEGANMPSTPEAVDLFLGSGILFGPGKAANAGGVSVSGLEMTQNSMRIQWSRDEVDSKLHYIMKNIHTQCVKYGREGDSVNYVKGANLAGFIKVADAMLDQGVV